MRTVSARQLTALVCVIGSLACTANASTLPIDQRSTPASLMQATTAASEMVIANPSGKATVMAVVDYQGYPIQIMREQLSAFTKENPDIKLVIKPWASGGPLSRFAAKAAYAAAKQGKLPEFHAAMISDLGPHTWYSLRNAAPAMGIDWKRFEIDFEDEALNQRVDADARDIAALKIANNPAFIAGGRVFSGAWNEINFQKIADAARHANGSDAVAAREQ